jgi:hypothetical protein
MYLDENSRCTSSAYGKDIQRALIRYSRCSHVQSMSTDKRTDEQTETTGAEPIATSRAFPSEKQPRKY